MNSKYFFLGLLALFSCSRNSISTVENNAANNNQSNALTEANNLTTQGTGSCSVAPSSTCGGVPCVVRTSGCFLYKAGYSFHQIEEGSFNYQGTKNYPFYNKFVPNTGLPEYENPSIKWSVSTMAAGVGFWGSVGDNHCPLTNGNTTYELSSTGTTGFFGFNPKFGQGVNLTGIPIDAAGHNNIYRWTPNVPNGPIPISLTSGGNANCLVQSQSPNTGGGGSSFIILNRGNNGSAGGIGMHTVSDKTSGGAFRTFGPCGQGAKYNKDTSNPKGYNCISPGNSYGTGSYFSLLEDKGYLYPNSTYASAIPPVTSHLLPHLMPFSPASASPKFVLTIKQSVHSSSTFKEILSNVVDDA